MKVLYKNGLILDVAYIVNNNGTSYYQRGVPKDLQVRFGKTIIRLKLNSNDKRNSIAQQAAKFAKSHDQLFAILRANKDLHVSEQKLAALTLLQSFHLNSGAGAALDKLNNGEDVDELVMGNIAEFFEHYESLEKSGQLTETHRLAKKAFDKPLPLLLSEVLERYFENHTKGKDKAFIKRTKGRWDKLVEIVGDIALLSINRDTARKYRDTRLKETYGKRNPQPVRTTTIEREIKAFRAIINKVAKEEDLELRNPFEAINISGLGSDSNKREPFTKQELSKLLKSCIKDFDEIRCLIILQACTGARISEIAGLRKADIHKQNGIHHLSICEYGQRSVKTKNSIRLVPLVDLALKALLKHKDTLSKNDVALFPRYCDGKSVNGDAVSAAVNKYIKNSVGIPKTSHSLRHGMRDLLRSANISSDIAHEIGGWGSQQIAEQYGRGYALKIKLEALKNALEPIKVDASSLALNDKQDRSKAPLKASTNQLNKPSSFIRKLSQEIGRKANKDDIRKAMRIARPAQARNKP